MEPNIKFETTRYVDPAELSAFYERQGHHTTKDREKLERMIAQTLCFVTARIEGNLVGIARGITDGVRGYLTECKLDPKCQGEGCITRTDGRIEHDTAGIAREMATRVVNSLTDYGVDRIQVLAHGTEVDFCEELGFKRVSGMVALQLMTGATVPAGQA
jgi:hypothetical protein